MPLDEFFRTRIFEPLKMVDTSFFLPPAKADRLAAVYGAKEGGGLERAPNPQRGQGDYVDGPRKCFSGGAGLLSTASDYARFLQMLVNGGELDGHRLLSPKTVELATSNHVGTLFNEGQTGFGLGFEIVEHVGRSGRPGSVGEFSWGGAYYTSYWAGRSWRCSCRRRCRPGASICRASSAPSCISRSSDLPRGCPRRQPGGRRARRADKG
jgi:CubicO group peptidase (beta-lactamase class C family)